MILRAEHITAGYGQKRVLEDQNLTLESGEMVCLLGLNGSGKSTLLRTLAQLQPALDGRITVDGTVPEDWSRVMALVLTERPEMEHTTVRDMVAMGRYPYTGFLGRLREEDEAVVSQSLDLVGARHMEQRQFMELSDGEKQRVMLAKALAQDTPIIILDEPTSFLDYVARRQVMELLRQLAHEQNKAILLSTHEVELAQELADRIVSIS